MRNGVLAVICGSEVLVPHEETRKAIASILVQKIANEEYWTATNRVLGRFCDRFLQLGGRRCR
jgi:hypothetical protein